MLRLVSVQYRIDVNEPELLAQQFDVVGFAGEK
jgi:hypothetical protein